MRSRTFEAYVAPARERPQLWRLLVGATIIAAFWIAASALVFLLMGDFNVFQLGQDGTFVLLDAPAFVIGLLVTFTGPMIGVFLAVKVLHRRPIGSLFGPGARTLRHFIVAALITFVVLVLTLTVWNLFNDAEPDIPVDRWLMLLPLSLVLIAIQTGAEELIFRGYLQQQLAARFASPLAWMVVPSLLFAAMHFAPGVEGNPWVVVVGAGVFGFAAADLTARTGSLGAAWGLHFVNNLGPLLILSHDGPLSGLALYRAPYAATDFGQAWPWLLLDLVILIMLWAILRRTLGR